MTALPAASAPVSVLFASDRNYIQHVGACIASLAANNPTMDFNVLLVGTQEFGAMAEKLQRSFADNKRVRLSISMFDFPTNIHFPLPYHLTQETYIRFWAGDLFKEQKRVLYLDPDTIVTGSIEPLWNLDLQGRTLAAVPIPGSTRPEQHGMPKGSPFFNAGMLVFDLDAWRGKDYCNICLDYLSKHPEKAYDGDQDILNLCLQNDWLPLPYYWNVISPFYFLTHDLKLTPSEIEEVRRQALIIHFNGGSKPWSYWSEHPRKAEYWKYLRMTDWRDTPPTDYSLPNVVRKSVVRLIPPSWKKAIKAVMP